jgi:hypothetical protein
MKTKFLTGLLLLVVACSGGQTTGGEAPGETKAQQKKAAAEAYRADTASDASATDGDVCADKGWYGDDECDTFCRDYDSYDCANDTDGVICADFLEAEDGSCSRRADDPCISQDPDCAGSIEPSPPDPGIICTAIAQEADGVCPFGPDERPADPCLYYQDPDCMASGGTGSSPSEPTTPVCKAVPAPSDGTCSREPSDPCRSLDPDCDVACAEYIEVSDGVCKREPNDPCIFQDPDCHVK